MFGSFLPNLWSSTNQSLLGSKEPTLLCNHLDATFAALDLAVLFGEIWIVPDYSRNRKLTHSTWPRELLDCGGAAGTIGVS